jgi:hypothetical protein
MKRTQIPASLSLTVLLACALQASGQVKEQALTARPGHAIASANPAPVGGSGYRFTISNDVAHVPVVVVRGTPYEMGWQLGRLMKDEIRQLAPAAAQRFKQELQVSDETLDQVWATTAGHTDPRLLQQLAGLAEGSGVPVRTLQHVHCLPLLMPYSCSSIAAWGSATEDGHLYQTRNLDWSLKAGAHEFPAIIVYHPTTGHAHVTPTFAGFIGAQCGLNDAGIVLAEMGDASAGDAPYNFNAPHFTAWFRTILYDANSLTDALDIFQRQPQTKKYHFVFGDGRSDKRAVKLRTETGGSTEPVVKIWHDNDRQDELAPQVLSCVVYQDEGRGAFPTLEKEQGKLNAPKLIALANRIPIKGGNVMNVVFDATALRLWVSYAAGDKEAYQRPYVFLDMTKLESR